MPENPLLPDRKLRELHTLMLRTHALEIKQARTYLRARTLTRDALLAATTAQLLPGDLLSASPNDLTAPQLAPEPKRSNSRGPTTSILTPATPERLPQAAAAAKALQSTDNLILAFAYSNATEPGWIPALEWAHADQLPLILACADDTTRPSARTKPAPNTLSFASIARLAKRIKLPVLTVDGEDAVAVYRVMQEAVLRARTGGGPAVIWAILSPRLPKVNRSPGAIARLEQYLAIRKIPFTR